MSDTATRTIRWPAAATLVVLLLGTCLALWGIGQQDRVSSDRYDVRSEALGDEAIEEHATWVLDMLNGAPVSVSEIQQRLSPRFLLQLSAQDFLIETRLLAQEGPFEQRGYEIDTEATLVILRSALQARDGSILDFTLAWDEFTPDRIQGMTLIPSDSDRGPFLPIEALAHVLASWGLVGAGLMVWFVAKQPSAGTLLLATGCVWLMQLLELANNSFVYTVGLVAGPAAVALLALSLLAFDDNSFDGSGIAVGLLAVAAALASMATLLAIDTSVAELPDQWLAITHNADTAALLGALEQGMAVITSVCLSALLWWRYLRNRRDRTGYQQMVAVVGTMIAVIVVFIGVWGLTGDHHDLSQSPVISLAALFVPAGVGFQAVRENNDRLRGLVVSELRSSRSRILDSAEQARRGVERDLHDGAQQRLIALQLSIKLEQQRAQRAGEPVAPGFLGVVSNELGGAIDELRELGRGLRPSALDHGLRAAVESLAERSPLPIVTDIASDRAPAAVESAAYFVINEAVANATRHSGADHVRVTTSTADETLHVEISDNGVGGASNNSGTGLQSLEDRVVALDGTIAIESPPAVGTRVAVTLPFGEGNDANG